MPLCPRNGWAIFSGSAAANGLPHVPLTIVQHQEQPLLHGRTSKLLLQAPQCRDYKCRHRLLPVYACNKGPNYYATLWHQLFNYLSNPDHGIMKTVKLLYNPNAGEKNIK